MLSINTNLSSLIAQSSLKESTNLLNRAVERMTTGYKINGAKDNAANFSISTNMTTKISAYRVAEDNTAMGLDLVTTASEIIAQMEDKAERLRALSTQASNGTYGNQSKQAIQSEAAALMQEITRLYLSSEYNGVSLFDRQAFALPDTLPKAKAEYDGFIEDPKTYDDATVNAMASIDTFTHGASGTFKIEDADDLARLATLVNGGADTLNATFVLANDIDLADWCATHGNWVPIGKNGANSFKGTFDGNGHVIKNLKIDNPTANYQGLFGYISGGCIKNLGIEDLEIIGGSHVGAIVGYANSYMTYLNIQNCYSNASVKGDNSVGGLIGDGYIEEMANCYATGNVTGTGNNVGGLIGVSELPSSITNSYATGNVSGNEFVGGLIGQVKKDSGTATISSSYSLGDVTGTTKSGSFIGGVLNTTGGTYFGTVNISDCSTLDKGGDLISGCYRYNGDPNTNGYDAMLAGISIIQASNVSTDLQIGIYGDQNSRINFNTNFQYDLSSIEADISSADALNAIDEFLALLSAKQTELGAVTNRLESALDEIAIQYDNLVSSRSTLRDADIAKESSKYIQAQILQQASATLLATANQSPSIALQLI